METMKTSVKVDDSPMYDMEKLYSKLLVISQKRDITLGNMLSYELASFICYCLSTSLLLIQR